MLGSLWWLSESYLHQAYKPCFINTNSLQTYECVGWWSPLDDT